MFHGKKFYGSATKYQNESIQIKRRFKMWDIHKYYENDDYVNKFRVYEPDTIKEKITNEKLIMDVSTKYQKIAITPCSTVDRRRLTCGDMSLRRSRF